MLLSWESRVKIGIKNAHFYISTDAETFDVLELAEHVKKQRWWNKMFGKNNSGPAAEKYSVATQLAIGGVTGW